MEDVIEGLEAVAVPVREIGRARSFYRDILGLREGSFLPEASRAAFRIPGTTSLRTMPIPEEGKGGRREPGTVSGLVFANGDPVAACAEIRRRGGTVVDAPRTYPTPMGPATLGVLADPDGNPFVLRPIRS